MLTKYLFSLVFLRVVSRPASDPPGALLANGGLESAPAQAPGEPAVGQHLRTADLSRTLQTEQRCFLCGALWPPAEERAFSLQGAHLLGISRSGSDADPASGLLQTGHLTIKLPSSQVNWGLKRQPHVVHSVKAKAQSIFVELS